MPISLELRKKIRDYENQGYTPQQIISGLEASENHPDIAQKVKEYRAKGFQPIQILKGLHEAEVQLPERKGTFGQFQRIYDIHQQEVEAGLGAMREFAEKPTGKAAIQAGLGAVQYVASPLTAIGKGVFGEPFSGVPMAIGKPVKDERGYIRKSPSGIYIEPTKATEVAKETIEQAGETIPFAVPYSQMVRQAMKGGEIIRKAREAEKAAAHITKQLAPKKVAKPPLEYPTPPKPALAKELAAEGKLVKPVTQETIQKQVADAAIETLAKSPADEKRRIGQQVIDLVHSQQINWKELPDLLKKYNITPEEFAQRLKDTYSTAGRTLSRLSFVAKRVRGEMAKNPEAVKFYDKFIKELPEPTDMDKFFNVFRNIESARRGLLVTQLATAMRNATSQLIRASIGSLDDAFQGLVRGTVGGQGNTLKQIGEGLDTGIAFYHRFSPTGRKNLTRILESESATFAKAKLLSTPVHEIAVVGKITNALNSANKLQEYFFRRMGFEAKLAQLLKRKGMDIKNIDPSKITKEMWEEAVQYGLDISFASMPKSKAAKDFYKAMNQPIFTALLNPFPRFAYGNALPYIWNFSPISLLKAMNPKVVAELATGNPEKFAHFASKATLGTAQLAMGLWLRNSKHRGEHWYEVKVGDSVYDTRSYAPLLSPYLLLGEAMTHPDRLKPADWAQAAIGLNRISGTGLVLVDVLRGRGIENTMETVGRLTGAYLGSFSVPAKTWQDVWGAIEPEATKLRDVKESPVTGPFLRNIPFASETLPEAVSPLKSEIPRTEAPLLRQLTGLSKRTKTALEAEVDELQLEYRTVFPATGIPEADRLLASYMGPALEKIAPMFMERPNYKDLQPEVRRLIIKQLFKETKKAARIKLASTRPDLYRKIRWEGMDRDIRDILEEKGMINIR